MRNSKAIGNIGEAKVLCKFVELGIPVYTAFGDNEKADLIADFKGKLNRIQVKTSIKAENGKMIFDLTSSTINKGATAKHIYNKTEVDYFACYNISRDKIFLIPIESAPSTAITIRYEQAKNNQTKGVIMEEDFLMEKILSS